MIDIEKQIAHWRKNSEEDWQVAKELVERKRIRHGLFFAHLTLEKMLKAHVCNALNDIAPPIHNLVRLSEMSKLAVDENLRNLLAEVSPFNIQTRYPEMLVPEPGEAEAKAYINRIEEALKWLISQFTA